MNYCSRPGCRREAKPDDTLCGQHRAGRTRSSAATKPLIAPGFSRTITAGVYREVLEAADLIATNTDDPAERWLQLDGWLRAQITHN